MLSIKRTSIPKTSTNAYASAQDWAYDRYHSQAVIADRWQLAFWIQLILSLILAIAIIIILPLKSWEPIVIQRNTQTGEVWVDSPHTQHLPALASEVESDLVRYVIARETYAHQDAGARYQQVRYSSSPEVIKIYENLFSNTNLHHLQSLYGDSGMRTIKVEDVVFLTSPESASIHQANTHNLAKIDFITTDTQGQTSKEQYWVATISWEYLGTPTTKAAAWSNWNGFTVTYYRVDQRNIN